MSEKNKIIEKKARVSPNEQGNVSTFVQLDF